MEIVFTLGEQGDLFCRSETEIGQEADNICVLIQLDAMRHH